MGEVVRAGDAAVSARYWVLVSDQLMASDPQWPDGLRVAKGGGLVAGPVPGDVGGQGQDGAVEPHDQQAQHGQTG